MKKLLLLTTLSACSIITVAAQTASSPTQPGQMQPPHKAAPPTVPATQPAPPDVSHIPNVPPGNSGDPDEALKLKPEKKTETH
ncbi:MAG: hypothetical protein K2W82_10175 [Candidatus Obscuribacterales bacterium]|nr:hypothetical protein [Candidatus Obscuribacterales bacterium]